VARFWPGRKLGGTRRAQARLWSLVETSLAVTETTPFASAQPLLIQEWSRRKTFPSSDEEGWRVSAGVVEPEM